MFRRMFSRSSLAIDTRRAAEEIEAAIRQEVLGDLRRRGAVIGISGGIDSALVATLCTRALGPERVLSLSMPERDSSPDALRLAQGLADHLGIAFLVEPITDALGAVACYERQVDAIRTVLPDFQPGDPFKIILPSLLEGDRLNIPMLAVLAPDGSERRVRLPLHPYLQIVAATNFKQRTRTMLEYYHADRLHYAVAGTPNLLEYDQGFFVKQGDGAADFKPIAHLYKTQVFALAEHLGVPDEICARTPTTDTFSLPQTQEEFYFSLPYEAMDLCLWAANHAIPANEAAPVVGLTTEQVERVFRDIEAKRRATRYQHHMPMIATEIGGA
jgi:NAD+ synthase